MGSQDTSLYWSQPNVVNTTYIPDEKSVEDKQVLSSVLDRLPITRGKVLDFGCGVGRFMLTIIEKGYDYLGIDWSLPAIEIAKQHYPKLSDLFVCKEDFELDFEKEFDVAFTWWVFQHNGVQIKKRALIKLREALKVGGYLILYEGTFNSFGEFGLDLNFNAVEQDGTRFTAFGWINFVCPFGFELLFFDSFFPSTKDFGLYVFRKLGK